MKHLSILFALLFICSCANKKLVKEIGQFKGQQITLSSDWDAVWKSRDTVLTTFLDAPIKLVVWYDSLGCLSCAAGRMDEWNDIVSDADSIASWFRIIFLFTPKKDGLQKAFIASRSDKLNYPIFIDLHATFLKLNPQFPKNRLLHSFLLDKNNEVVMVGNPLYNPGLWELYKRTVQKMIDNDGVLPGK